MRAIHVLFYKPQSDDRWLNHVVTFFSPPYSHCDLQFEDGFATSIYQKETVYFEKKSFSRSNYNRISLTMSDDEYDKIYQFCVDAYKHKVGFDLAGMVGSYLPFSIGKPRDKTFCSRYVTEALQSAKKKEFNALQATNTTPSFLFHTLNNLNKSFLHIPEKRMLKLTDK